MTIQIEIKLANTRHEIVAVRIGYRNKLLVGARIECKYDDNGNMIVSQCSNHVEVSTLAGLIYY